MDFSKQLDRMIPRAIREAARGTSAGGRRIDIPISLNEATIARNGAPNLVIGELGRIIGATRHQAQPRKR